MKIGRLRHLVTIEELHTTRDSFGAEVPEWIQFAKVWGEVTTLSGREFDAFKQISSEITTKVTLRYLSGVDPEMRVRFKDRILEIKAAINQEEKDTTLVLMCKEVV